MEEKDRSLDALDLQVPKAKALSDGGSRSLNKTTSLSPKSGPEPLFASSQPDGPRLDNRRLGGRNRMSRTRREAARHFDSSSARTQSADPDLFKSKRLEIRAHAVQDATLADDPAPQAHKRRQWKTAAPVSRSRKTMSMPPQRSSQFIVVDEEVEDTSSPVCGINLGPCVPSFTHSHFSFSAASSAGSPTPACPSFQRPPKIMNHNKRFFKKPTTQVDALLLLPSSLLCSSL